ncbi:MAG: DNA-binding domain-containing protein [Gammaproteobacteria bacterium]|nr:DNA-binding domain-containing protein [Gammaproteobacteria bacterium]
MSAAPSLPELQRLFAEQVTGGTPSRPDLDSCIAGHGLAPAARLQIYRNVVFHNLSGALKTAYPAVLALVGVDFFEGAAARYIRDYPSVSGNLQDYGARFPAFLSDMPEAHGVPYLADIARLEWARQQAYLAEDAWPLDPETVSGIAPEMPSEPGLRLHPSVRLVESRYPVFDIWMYCQQAGTEPPSLDSGGQRVLLWRDQDQVAMRAIEAPGAAFIGDMLTGVDVAGLGEQAAKRRAGGFDPSSFLLELLRDGLVTGCTGGGDRHEPARNTA